jgi:hypothetical protein
MFRDFLLTTAARHGPPDGRGSAAAVLDPDAAMNEDEAAEFLGVSPRTLQRLRQTGGGPPYVRIAGRINYRRRRLVEFAAANEFAHSSEEVVAKSRGRAA